MAGEKNRETHIPSKFLNVCGVLRNGKTHFIITIKGFSRTAFKTEREAAIAVDKILIQQGKKPVNILIKKATE